MDERRNELLQVVGFGKLVEEFWGSAVGQYLASRAQEYYNAGIEELKTVDPTDYRAVFNAQCKVFMGEGFNKWLSQAVQDGLDAMGILEGEIEDETE